MAGRNNRIEGARKHALMAARKPLYPRPQRTSSWPWHRPSACCRMAKPAGNACKLDELPRSRRRPPTAADLSVQYPARQPFLSGAHAANFRAAAPNDPPGIARSLRPADRAPRTSAPGCSAHRESSGRRASLPASVFENNRPRHRNFRVRRRPSPASSWHPAWRSSATR